MVKRVFRIFYDYEKLEIWLNEMSRKGWDLDSFFLGLFKFSKGTPGEYIYRVELLPHFARNADSQKYLNFLKGMEVEIVTIWVKWAVYRKKSCEGEFNIYSDIDSRIIHYLRISKFLFLFSIIEFLIALSQVIIFILNFKGNTHSTITAAATILFAASFGLIIFNAALRSFKKHKQLKKEKNFRE